MPPKFFWVENAILHEKESFSKKISIFRKIIASLVILQNENVQAHEIGGLALQKKKIVLTMRTTQVQTLIFVDLKWSFHKK